MNVKRILLFVVLSDFLVLTGWGVYELGYVGFFQELLSSTAGIVAAVDLVIALSLVLVWMVRDARAHGISPAPYVVLTLALGSVGPLLYLLRRPEPVAEPHVRLAAQAS